MEREEELSVTLIYRIVSYPDPTLSNEYGKPLPLLIVYLAR